MMMKLKRIDGGMYCLLLTFDPSTDVVNIVDLQASGVGNLVDQSEKTRFEKIKTRKNLRRKPSRRRFRAAGM